MRQPMPPTGRSAPRDLTIEREGIDKVPYFVLFALPATGFFLHLVWAVQQEAINGRIWPVRVIDTLAFSFFFSLALRSLRVRVVVNRRVIELRGLLRTRFVLTETVGGVVV